MDHALWTHLVGLPSEPSSIGIVNSGAQQSPCACCGKTSQSLQGYAQDPQGVTYAAYLLHWTPADFGPEASPDRHPAHIDLILGHWGEDRSGADRCAISLIYFVNEAGPALSIIDAGSRPVAQSPLAAHALSRAEVVGTALAPRAFALFDAIVAQDPCLIRAAPESTPH